jgi:phage host-nuclease inhibitor protein Gam
VNREEVERVVREIAEKTLALLQERADLDEILFQARKEHDKRIAALTTAIASREAQVAAWAEANRTEFNGQSLALRHGLLSFRKGNWHVGLLEGWTWDGALVQLKKLKELRKFIRRQPEIDKRKLLQARESTDEDLLEQAGLCFDRGERFSIEPKLETVLPLRQAA